MAVEIVMPKMGLTMTVGSVGKWLKKEGDQVTKGEHVAEVLSACREAGVAPETVLGVLAWWCGWAAWGERVALRDLLPRFDLATLPHERIVLTQEVKDYLKIV